MIMCYNAAMKIRTKIILLQTLLLSFTVFIVTINIIGHTTTGLTSLNEKNATTAIFFPEIKMSFFAAVGGGTSNLVDVITKTIIDSMTLKSGDISIGNFVIFALFVVGLYFMYTLVLKKEEETCDPKDTLCYEEEKEKDE